MIVHLLDGTYELFRHFYAMPPARDAEGREVGAVRGVLNSVLGSGKKGIKRKQKIDGSKLPEYDFVRRYLGPAGLQMISEDNGWIVKGFLLKKGQ